MSYADKFAEAERDPAVTPPVRITGVMMQYYAVCERELWFEYNGVRIDKENQSIRRGMRIDEQSYERERENLDINQSISPDLLQGGSVVEVKPSSDLTEGAKLQLLYYLWYLEEVVGVSKDGVLAHPSEKNRETVSLTEKNHTWVETAIDDIYEIVTSKTPPELKKKPYCDSCAFQDYCWL